MRLDTFLRPNFFNANKNMQDGQDMVLNKNVEFYMKLIKHKEISKTEAALRLNYSRRWIPEIYKRYINNQNLEKVKPHRKKVLNESTQKKLINLYKQLSYFDRANYTEPTCQDHFKEKIRWIEYGDSSSESLF